MIRLPQRLSFQLTPLLDLLLIVIFAQYLDVRENTKQQAEATPTVPRTQVQKLAGQIENLKQQIAQTQSELERTRQQQKLAGDLVAELFQVDHKLIDEVFQVSQPQLQPRSQQDIDQLKLKMQQLSQLRGNAVIKHLLTIHELGKRADTWQVNVTAQGIVKIQMATRKFNFAVENAEEFARRFYQSYKSIAEPKGLVLILFSYGDALEKDIRDVWNGLQQSIDKIRVDRNFRTQLEYANIGYLPVEPNELKQSLKPDE